MNDQNPFTSKWDIFLNHIKYFLDPALYLVRTHISAPAHISRITPQVRGRVLAQKLADSWLFEVRIRFGWLMENFG